MDTLRNERAVELTGELRDAIRGDPVTQLVSSGVAAANALDLTTQMPVQQTFLCRSRSRKRYCLGKQEISLHQAIRALATPEWDALLAVRAELPIWLVELVND